MLFRFLRGSGGAGLAAIRPVTADGHCAAPAGRRPRRRGTIPARARHRLARRLVQRQLAIRAQSHPPPVAAATGPRMESGHRRDPEPCRRLGVGGGGILGGGNRPRGCRLSDRNGTVRCWCLRRLCGNCRWRWLAGWCASALERAKGDLRGVDFAHIAAILKMACVRGGARARRRRPAGRSNGRSIGFVSPFRSPTGRRPRAIGWPRPCRAWCGCLAPIAISLELIEKAETLERPGFRI